MTHCPLCEASKGRGLVVCWPCWNLNADRPRFDILLQRMESTMQATHYNPHRFTPRYIMFGSRWGEMVIVDRESKRSYYEMDSDTPSNMDRINGLSDYAFDIIAADYVQDGGEANSPLPPSVVYWMHRIDLQDGWHPTALPTERVES